MRTCMHAFVFASVRPNVPTCAAQFAAQLPIFAAPQHRHARAILLLIAGPALDAARRVGSRRQLEIRRRLARVTTKPALHTRGELSIGLTLDFCVCVCVCVCVGGKA